MSQVQNSSIHGRNNDTMGIGYFHLTVSNLPILTIRGIGVDNGVDE